VYGTNLSKSTNKYWAVPISTYSEDVQVSIGGFRAPLLYVSPTLINVQVPWEVTARTGAPAIVTRGNLDSPAFGIDVATYAPAVFVCDTNLDAIATRLDGSLITNSHPASSSEVIIVYGTGLGDVIVPPFTGCASEMNTSRVTPTVTLAGGKAEVLYSGLAPGFVGLAQFNLKLPPAIPVHGGLALVITFGAISSKPVLIWIE
jgi:uncharacterized protein (TIGR03437 family)